jgi:hypothetical protein
MKNIQEEPKQENCCTPIGQIKRYVDCKGCDRKPKQENDYSALLQPVGTKQETLEEAAERYRFFWLNNKTTINQVFIDGAKSDAAKEYWFNIFQQEQDKNKYSEEDMIKAIYFGASGMHGYQMGEEGYEVNQIKRFLEQFKKK